jgi:pyridoxamine 5'-phosphate oxidase
LASRSRCATADIFSRVAQHPLENPLACDDVTKGTDPQHGTWPNHGLDEHVDTPDLAAMRQEYARAGLAESDLAPNWLTQFERWLDNATAAGLPEPNAMIVASVDADGRPNARTVLLKGLDERGFVFYTNYASAKGRELAANPYASLVFPWHAISRQVRASGPVTQVDRTETEAYFATRPRESQLGAWASDQSAIVPDRIHLDQAYAEVAERFGDEPVPAPPHWGGLRVRPDAVEFWQGRTGRLHDRLRYRRTDDGWTVERLAP